MVRRKADHGSYARLGSLAPAARHAHDAGQLIVVGVAMDTIQQIESQLVMRHYDGFMKRGRIRGRR